MPPGSIPKKTRSRISDKQKKEICEFAKMNPSYKQHQIANEFNQCYPDLKMDRSTVSKILKKTDEYQQIEDHKYVEKAQQFAQALDMPEESLTFSNGWISRFTRRNGLRPVTIHGEAESAPLETLPAEHDKTRVTVLLCSNSMGSDKLRPLVIGTSKKPQSFNGINRSQLPVTYKNNKKAQVLLLVDNASSHMAPETSNSAEVQDAKESVLEDDSDEEIEVREQPGGRSHGRSRGRTQGRRPQGETQRSNPANSGRSRQISDKLQHEYH
ncbi:19829_t:CDS:2, partial [Gigaspora rosea]